MKDFYYILGTSNNATPPEVDAAYQKLAQKFRQNGEEPDEFMDSHFREITEAYDVLRDPVRRRKYDAAIKRNQNRRLAVFKISYLNIAVAITFLIVTALFANYVIHAIRGHEAKIAAVTPKPVIDTPVVRPVHPKKRHRILVKDLQKPLPVQQDTIAKPVARIVPPPAPPIIVDSTYATTLHANITGIVYLHLSADYNSAVLAKIPDASEIRVLQKGPAYYKIMFNGQVGYVLKNCVVKPARIASANNN